MERVTRAERGASRAARLSIALQVAALVLLCAGAAGLVTWLAGRPGLHARVDLTATERNTLDPVLASILEDLPETAEVEVFFRAVPEPMRQAAAEAQSRTSELLFVARNEFPTRLRVIEHDLRDVARAGARLSELGVQADNVVVVSIGGRRAVLHLARDLARFTPGDVQRRIAPTLESFVGDRALGEALLSLSSGERMKIYFAHGSGERDPYESGTGGLNDLRAALTADGFDVAWWEPGTPPRVPEDCGVLAVVDPRQAWTAEVLEAVRAWMRAGGRLFVAPSRDDALAAQPGSTTDLLRSFGIDVAPGFVAQLKPDALGNFSDGSQECAFLYVPSEGFSARHPVSEPLARLGASLRGLPLVRAFGRVEAPAGAAREALLTSSPETWRDLPDARGNYDWRYQAGHERPGPYALAEACEFPPPDLVTAPPAPGDGFAERPRSRVIAFGSPDALANQALAASRDLVLNAFNWLAARDWRLNVRPRDPDRRRVDLESTTVLSQVKNVAFLGLPGVFAVIGIAVAFRRRR
jgi:hypothetical protein